MIFFLAFALWFDYAIVPIRSDTNLRALRRQQTAVTRPVECSCTDEGFCTPCHKPVELF